MTTPAIVLGQGITALSVVRSIGRLGHPVWLLGSNKNDIAYHSRYARTVDGLDVHDAGQLVRRLQAIRESLGCKPVLLCCSDPFLEMISANRDVIRETCLVNIPSAEAVATVLNKGLFGDFCAKYDLPAPRSWKVDTSARLAECRAAARFPVAIKPVFSHKAKFENYLGSGAYAKIIVTRNVAELDRYYDEFTLHGASLLVQEYIEGPDSGHYSYVSYRNSESTEVAGVGIRKLRLLPVHAGVGTFAEVTEDAELAILANKVLDKLDYKGISSVCFKRDANSGGLRLHEINGRFPQPHSGSRLCNIDFARIAYQDALGQEPEVRRVPSRGRKWIALGLDIDAFREYRREGELSTLEWLKSLCQVRVCAEFAAHDLRPFFFFLRRLLRRLAARGPNKRTQVTPVAQPARPDLE